MIDLHLIAGELPVDEDGSRAIARRMRFQPPPLADGDSFPEEEASELSVTDLAYADRGKVLCEERKHP